MITLPMQQNPDLEIREDAHNLEEVSVSAQNLATSTAGVVPQPFRTAISLARKGLPVFPLRVAEKTPFLPGGFQIASSDLRVVEEWARLYPRNNYGIPTGAVSGFFVLDVDQPGGPASLEALESQHGALSETVRLLTGGGGFQYLFKMPEGADIRNSAKVLAEGLDIRGTGGYIAGPGCIHPSGGIYRGEIDLEKITEAPQWLLTLIAETAGGKRGKKEKSGRLEGRVMGSVIHRATGLVRRSTGNSTAGAASENAFNRADNSVANHAGRPAFSNVLKLADNSVSNSADNSAPGYADNSVADAAVNSVPNSSPSPALNFVPNSASPSFSEDGVEPIAEGRRNEELFKRACSLRAKGLGEFEIATLLRVTNENECDPPLEDEEIIRIVESACGYAPGTGSGSFELEAALEELNAHHAAVMLEGKFYVIWETEDHKGNKTQSFLRSEDFHALHANRFVTTLRGNRHLEVSVSKEWFKWPGRRQYKSVVFAPGQETQGYYNLYKGMGVIPREGDWSLFKEHILENIASGNEVIYEYILNYLARIIQAPGSPRPGVAIVMRGAQGTGKGLFVRNIGDLFPKHFVHISKPRHLVGHFNKHLSEAIVVFVDEGFFAGDKAAEGTLKVIITEPTTMLEAKGRDAFPIESHMNFFIASNNDWVIPAGKDERRFMVLDVSEKKKQNTGYFAKVQEQMDSGGREAMVYDLLRRDISTVDLRKYPRTGALTDQVLMTLDPVGKFWYEKLITGRLINAPFQYTEDYEVQWNPWVPTAQLGDEFTRYIARNSIRFNPDLGQLMKKLNEYCPGIVKSRGTRLKPSSPRPYGYTIPSLAECRKAFDTYLGQPLDWGDEAECEDKEIAPLEQSQPAEQERLEGEALLQEHLEEFTSGLHKEVSTH